MGDTESRDERIEELIRYTAELRDLLRPAEQQLTNGLMQPQWPTVLVLGSCRSGTTLVMQWLAASGQFAYPSNLLSRFYETPAVGARIQTLLTDPRFRFGDELDDLAKSLNYDSKLGKTRGALQPNEYWHFWRRFIPNDKPRYITPEEAAQVDGDEFAAELAAVERAFEKPFAMKGIILQYNIPVIARTLDRVLFVYVKRHPFYNAQSLLEARETYFNSRDEWYSGRPKEYAELVKLDPISQVAGQVHYTDAAIREGFAGLSNEQHITLDYEQFCENPAPFYAAIRDRMQSQGCEINTDYTGPASFDHANEIRLSDEEAAALRIECERYAGHRIEL